MKTEVSISVGTIEVEGVSPLTVIDHLYALKQNLESKGIKVTIKVEGQEFEWQGSEKAGDGTRTHDILLGNFPVTSTTENSSGGGE